MNIFEIFDNKERATYSSKPRTYDVGVTINHLTKEGRTCVRFGFLNNGKKAFDGKRYIQPSNVEKFPERVYFKLHDERKYADCYRLSRHNAASLEMKFQPSPAALEIYKRAFVGRHTLKFDVENQLYYIEAINEQQREG